MSKNFYVTTPIYYVNGDPHVGTAYTTIAADVIARFRKTMGDNVYFLTGNDEHGQKVEQTAEKNNYSPQEWTDVMSVRFKEMWKTLNVDYSDFIRTTEDRHIKAVQKILKTVHDNGDIYKGEYEGNYCISCETFVPDNQIENNKCPDCSKDLVKLKEESYFFKMSKYQDALLEHIDKNEDFILPHSRRNEVISFIKQGLQDLSISRNTFTWGIPIEFAEGHITYVWFDALTNYLTAVGYESDPEKFDKYWNNAHIVQLLGKDILRFHAIIWPCMLMSAGLKLPENIVAHGWWTSEGEKMSKSKGNVVNPFDETEKYGVDAFRYYLLREASFGSDGDYSTKSLVTRINADLANDLGNLLNRTLGMYKKYFSNVISEDSAPEDIEREIYAFYDETIKQVEKHMSYLEFSKALEAIWRLISRLNKYIDETSPWALSKDEANKKRLARVMNTLVNSLYKIAVLVYPTMPDSAQKIWDQLNVSKDIKKALLPELDSWNLLEVGHILSEATPIFPRLDIEEILRLEEEKKMSNINPNLEINDPVDIKDFDKLKIQVVEVASVEKLEGSSKLLKFKIKLENHARQVISGIAKSYPNPEELVGKKVLAVTNLKPVVLKGEISQAMLLTTEDKKLGAKLIEIDSKVAIGALIK